MDNMNYNDIASFRRAPMFSGEKAEKLLKGAEIVGRTFGSKNRRSQEIVHCYIGKYQSQPVNLLFNI